MGGEQIRKFAYQLGFRIDEENEEWDKPWRIDNCSVLLASGLSGYRHIFITLPNGAVMELNIPAADVEEALRLAERTK